MLEIFRSPFLLLLSFVLCATVESFAQDPIEKEVAELVSVMRTQSRNPDSLLFYADKLLQVSNAQDYDPGRFRAYVSMGQALSRKGDVNLSNDYLHKALRISLVSENERETLGVLNNLALNHRRLRRNDSSMYYFQKIKKKYDSMGLQEPVSTANMNIGLAHMQYQQLDSAEYYFNNAFKGFVGIKDERSKARVINLLGEVSYQKKDYANAILLADSSLSISKRINFKPNFGSNYYLMARAYEMLGDADKTKEYSKLAEEHRAKVIPANAGVRSLNEKAKAENTVRKFQAINQLEEDKAIYKSKLFLSVLIILVLATLIIVIHQKNKRIKAEVAELQKRVDEHKDNPENDTYLSAQKVILKSKAVLNCQDIIYVKSDGHYVEYYLKDKNKPEVDRNTMAEVLNELPERAFIRIHRSYIVNIQSIKIINSKRVMLDNGEWINLSRTFKPDLYKALNKA